MLIAGCVLAVLACHSEPVVGPQADPVAAQTNQQSEQGLSPDADTYISRTQAGTNFGTEAVLHLDEDRRTLLRWDTLAIKQALGDDSLVLARIELTIVSNGENWGPAGRAVGIHRMSREWIESEAVWARPCPMLPDVLCLAWNMDVPICAQEVGSDEMTCFPWDPSATDTTVVGNDTQGLVEFDVTADVAAILAGDADPYVHGWLLKRVDEQSPGAVAFGSRESGSPPRLVLTTEGQDVPDPVPAVAPDTVPQGFYDVANLRSGSACTTGRMLRGIVAATFEEGATQAQKQEAIDLIGGHVVGGIRVRDDIEGVYYVQVEDDPDAQVLCDAIETLNALPQVRLATPEMLVSLFYRRPNETGQWTRDQWRIDPGSVPFSERWALEAIAAPLAWGCAVGGVGTPIAVVDEGFQDAVPDLLENVAPEWRGDVGVNNTTDHGTRVASVLAARGDNGEGITGTMWRADLRLYDTRVVNGVLSEDTLSAAYLRSVATRVQEAAGDGAIVINLSSGLGWLDPPGPGRLPGSVPDSVGHDSAQAAIYRTALRLALEQIPESPLLIIAAGNDGIDASWAGFPGVVLDFPDRVLVVAGSDIEQDLTQGSNRNVENGLVELAAPGGAITALNGVGSPITTSGTSFAAPYVAGAAGLVNSFDPQSASALKQRILEGAARGGRTAGGIPLLNAYESLRAAAERPGAPLCGQEVWAADGQLQLRRTQGGAPETLRSVPELVAQLEVLHGGRFIRYLTQQGGQIVGHSLAWDSGTRQWDPAPLPSDWQELRGGTLRSVFGFSHDQDSVAFIDDSAVATRWYETQSTEIAPVLAQELGASPQEVGRIQVDNLPTPLEVTCIERDPNDGSCFLSIVESRAWLFRLGYPQFPQANPGQRDAYVTVSPTQVVRADSMPWVPCGTDPSHECREVTARQEHVEALVYRLDLATPSSSPTPVGTIPDTMVFWIGEGENGGNVALMRGRWDIRFKAHADTFYQKGSPFFGQTQDLEDCAIEYRTRASFGEAGSLIPVSQGCDFGTLSGPSIGAGGGTIAPSIAPGSKSGGARRLPDGSVAIPAPTIRITAGHRP